MNENQSAAAWAAGRGDRWVAGLSAMEATLAPVDGPLIEALGLVGASRIADVGCGGGGTALEIARRAPAGSVVHGFDMSPKLVELARARPRPADDAVAFDVADVATTVPGRPYDRLVSRFGVMFFEDPPSAFANLARWLEPGGRFAFAVWGPLSDNPWMDEVRGVVAGVVDVPAPAPDAPGPFRYADAGALLKLLGRAGFSDVGARDWRGLLAIGGGLAPAQAADFALTSFSNFGELLAAAGDAAVEDARRALTDQLGRHARDGAVRLGARVHLITGSRP